MIAVDEVRDTPEQAPRTTGSGLSPPVERAGGDTSTRSRARTWVADHWKGTALLAALLLVVATVHAVGMTRSPAPLDDEGTYVAQAWAVRNWRGLAHYTYWYDHPPLGWIQIAGLTWLIRPFTEGMDAIAEGRVVMLLFNVVSAGLLFLVARRLGLRQLAAAGAVLLFALSPLAVSHHRLVYLDNVATPWLLGSFALALSPRRRLWEYTASGLCFAVAVLSKETSLLVLPALLTQLWLTCDHRTRSFCVTAFGVTTVLLGALYPLYALLKGELLPGPDHVSLFDAIRFQLVDRASSGSVFSPGSNARGVVEGWLALDRLLLFAGVASLPFALAIRRLRAVGVALLVVLLAVLRGGYLPGPFVLLALPFAALVIPGLLDELWGRERWSPARWTRERWTGARRAGVVAAVVAAIALAGPVWRDGVHAQMTVDRTNHHRDAVGWLQANIDQRQRLLVDNSMWVDLVEHGLNARTGVVWFFKLDSSDHLDPEVQKLLPGGWKEFDYVVSTPAMRGNLSVAPDGFYDVRQALQHSTVVVSFSGPGGRVEIRRIDPAVVDPDALRP